MSQCCKYQELENTQKKLSKNNLKLLHVLQSQQLVQVSSQREKMPSSISADLAKFKNSFDGSMDTRPTDDGVFSDDEIMKREF